MQPQSTSRQYFRHIRPGLHRRPVARTVPLLRAVRRRDWVTAQFGTGQQARAYAEAHGSSRFFTARIQLLHRLLAQFPEGELLDAGCGPGALVHSLLGSPFHKYRITALDQSEAMIGYCVANDGARQVRAVVGDLEKLPFGDAMFNVTVSTGALEYADARAAVRQLSRVTKRGGVVVVSMLNPLNPYRLTEWFLFWPALRVLSSTIRLLRIQTRRPHGANRSGIRALPSWVLSRHLRQSGLLPVDVVYFDLTPLVPPLDRIPVLRRWSDRCSLRVPTTRRWLRWMATGYVIIAYRS
jgi:SAM-dependent methyltransferase